MTMTVEVGYDDAAEQKLEGLREDVGSTKTELKNMKVVTR